MTNSQTERSDSVDCLYLGLASFLTCWVEDPAGPWWEADAAVRLGAHLTRQFEKWVPGEIDDTRLPPFLKGWADAPRFHRFGAENFLRGRGRNKEKLPNDDEANMAIPEASGGRYPDFFCRSEHDERFEWVLELKIGTVPRRPTPRGQNTEVTDFVDPVLLDIRKWGAEETAHSLALALLNVPAGYREKGDSSYFFPRMIEMFEDKFREKAIGDRQLLIATKKIEGSSASLDEWAGTGSAVTSLESAFHRKMDWPDPHVFGAL